MPPAPVRRGSKTPKLRELFEKVTDGTSNTTSWNDDAGPSESLERKPPSIEKAHRGPNEGLPGPEGGKHRIDLTESDKPYEERVRDYERKLVKWKASKEASESHKSTKRAGLNPDAASGRGPIRKLKDGQPPLKRVYGNKKEEIKQHSGVLESEETAASQSSQVLLDRGPNENHGNPFKRKDKGKGLEISDIRKRVRLRDNIEERLGVEASGGSRIGMNELITAQRSRASIRDLNRLQDDWQNEAAKMNKTIGKGLAQLDKHKNTSAQKRITKKSPFLSAIEQMNLMLADELRKGIPEVNFEIEDDDGTLEPSDLSDEEELYEPQEPQDDGISQHWADLCAPLPPNLPQLTHDTGDELQGATTD